MAEAKETVIETGLAKPDEIAGMWGDYKPNLPRDLVLPEIKISREAVMFMFPGDEAKKSFDAYLLHSHASRSYWVGEYNEAGSSSLPTCISVDGLVPIDMRRDDYEMQAKVCAECKHDAWGSGKEERGKACQQQMRLYFFVPGNSLPYVLKVPPTSLGKRGMLKLWFGTALNAVSSAVGKPILPLALTTWELLKSTSASGFSTAILKPTLVSVTTDRDMAKAIATMFRASSRFWTPEVLSDHISQESADKSEGGTETQEAEWKPAEPGSDVPF